MMPRLTALLIGALYALAASAASAHSARQDAADFILEKLQRKNGDRWEYAGKLFDWRFAFTDNQCTLTVDRTDPQTLVSAHMEFPLAQAVPQDADGAAVNFRCDGTQPNCLSVTSSATGPQGRKLDGLRLPIMQSSDAQPLLHALTELHRLCAAPYGGG
jgi:hypothetical protein